MSLGFSTASDWLSVGLVWLACLQSERLLDPEICGPTGFVTSSPSKDFNMKSAAVGNPQGASQGQTIDAPISVMFPALKRTLNPAKSTRPEFEVLVSKENGRVENSFISRVVSLPEISLLWLLLLPHSPLSWQQRERDRCLLKTRTKCLDPALRCNITRSSREYWWGG